MQQYYSFEPVLVRNRLGQGMTLQVYAFTLSTEHLCLLVKVSEGAHHSVLAKNIENIVFQLRERFGRGYNNFSMIELRQENDNQTESWYSWRFDWLANMPIDTTSQLLTSQQKNYYQDQIVGFSQASNGH